MAKNIEAAVDAIKKTYGKDFRKFISDFERSIKTCDGKGCLEKGRQAGITADLLTHAYNVKKAAAQIDVLIHVTAITLMIPQIIDKDEYVEYVSLGAGNTGRKFDLETNKRIAEFKFIHWQGGSEAIRQNSLFKDFFYLAEADINKRKELYVLDTHYPLKFFNGRRSISSVVSKNEMLAKEFQKCYGSKFNKVCEYYQYRKNGVTLRDASDYVPELNALAEESAEIEAALL